MSTLSHLSNLLAHEEGRAAQAVATATPLVWRRCAWHGEIIGLRAADAAEVAGTVTDTICAACRERFFRQAAGGLSKAA